MLENIRPEVLIYIPVMLFSLTVHEFAHALAAKLGGDHTATYQGRLTLNPIVHMDPIGTVLMPLLAIFQSGFPMLFWAKPVPVNLLRLRHSIWHVYVALAGPASNLLLAALAVTVLKLIMMVGGLPLAIQMQGPSDASGSSMAEAIFLVFQMFIHVNIWLAIFNMIPLPPLDGSTLVYYFFIRGNHKAEMAWLNFSQYGFIALFLMIQIRPVQDLLARANSIPFEFVMNWVKL
ncbi:MAG: site-2 protease family protein [Candidatus Sumerlaeaceae bacterium]|nr:site-2 protease family protein [Candidatus Sumerlaeaceae bacterium]